MLLLVFLVGSVGAYICQDETDVNDIPCIVITPILPNCTSNASVKNIVTNEQWNYTMNENNDGTCEFSFDHSTGSYSITLPDGSSGSIVVDTFATTSFESWIYVYILIIIVFGILMFGINKEDYFITLLACFGLFALSIYLFVQGINIEDNLLGTMFAAITFGIAAYVSLRTVIALLQENY
jgi:hypothetical protein